MALQWSPRVQDALGFISKTGRKKRGEGEREGGKKRGKKEEGWKKKRRWKRGKEK